MINNLTNKNFSLFIHASTQKWLLILIPHFFAFIVVIGLLQVSLFFSILLISIISLSAYFYLRLHIWLNLSKSVKRFYQDSKNNWFLITTDNSEKKVCLMPESFNSNYLIILNFIDENKSKNTVIVTPDSASREQFRQLRINLRTQ